MEIIVLINTYNTYGGHSSISLVGEFFELGIPEFGDAIKELVVHVYFKGGRAKKTLETLFEKYHRYIEGLPNSIFHRKKNRFELSYLSSLGDSSIVSEFGPPKIDLFVDSAKEIASVLPAMKAKLKKNDNFDLEAFLIFIENKMNQLPKNEDEFLKLQEKLEVERKKKLDSMDEWDKLGIDWIDFHPKAREILDSPFFWSSIDDFSPNGNDTGADVLGIYQEWRKKNRIKSGILFFEQLMSNWRVQLPLSDNDEFSRETYEKSIVGLVFAQIKVDGKCESKIRELALDTIQKIKKRISTFHRDWDLYDERMRTLLKMENKLK
jgi:uncharacterized protein YfeS